jgi:hypothetical protein
MVNCANCGNPLSASDTRCGRCGAMVSNQSIGGRRSGYMSTQQVAYPKSSHHGSGSILVPVIAVFSLISGIESILYASNVYKYNPNLSQLNSLHSMLGSIGSTTPYILGISGVIALVASFGYLKRISWAWKIGLVSAVLSIVTITAPNIIGFLLGVACLCMLFTPSLKSALKH